MSGREDMRSHTCDLCGEGFANKQDFDAHNQVQHAAIVKRSGDPDDRPPPVVEKAVEPNAERPRTEETDAGTPDARPEAAQPDAEEPATGEQQAGQP